MVKATQYKNVKIRGDKIQLDFRINGIRCRETLNIPPTEKNLKIANDLMGKIRIESAFNQFRYTDHFPNGARAAHFGETRTTRMNISEAMDWWFELEQKNWAKSYKLAVRGGIKNHISPYLGNFSLSRTTSAQIKEWINELDLSNKTINNIMSYMRGMFNLAVKSNLIKTSAMEGIDSLNVVKPTPLPLKSFEIDKVLDVMDVHTRAFYEVGIWTGLRTGEQSAITWDDLNFHNNTLYVGRVLTNEELTHTKNPTSLRLIELLEPAYQAFRELEKLKLHDTWVFVNPNTHEPWENHQITKFWHKALKEIGISKRPPYQTRHTFATLMLNAGLPLSWIKEQMGHSNYQMLETRYAKWQHDPDIVEWLEEKTRGGHNGRRFESLFYRNQ